MRMVSEAEFTEQLKDRLPLLRGRLVDFVTGPGRSGAVAAVYMSHALGRPFLPFGACRDRGARVLVVDTTIKSGRTVRRACRLYGMPEDSYFEVVPPTGERLKFWYEELADLRSVDFSIS